MALLVLFDLDGTLLDGGGLPGAMRATCEALATGLPGGTADALVAANTSTWQRLWPEVEDDYMLGGRSGDEIGRDVWRETLAACGLRGDDMLDRAVTEWFRQERAALRLYPDVLPTLDRLERRGIRLGMVTNGAATVQRRKVAAVGLAGRLDPLVVSGDVGVRKPDRAIFDDALERAGTLAADALFVGDHRWHDLLGAQEAGIGTVWLDRAGVGLDGTGPTPDLTIRTLAGLPAFADPQRHEDTPRSEA